MLLIPFADGQRLSVEQALTEAHTLGDICGNSTLETFAFYRFLAALLQAVYAPKLEDVYALQARGRFDPARVAAFCTQYPLTPTFGQVPDLEGKIKSIGYLVMDEPTGSDTLFFRHKAANKDKAFCEQCVLAGILSIPAWQSIGGLNLTASINGTPPLYFLPKADTLFETLVRCLVPDPNPSGGLWERTPQFQTYTDVSLCHGLTFMPRLIRVLWQTEGAQRCTRCGAALTGPWAKEAIHVKGERWRGEAWRDPYVAYVEREGRTYPLALRKPDQAYGAAILKGLTRVAHLPQLFALWPDQKAWRVFGAITNQAKWEDTFVEDITLPEEPAA